jgi:hypothetical protein
MNLDEVIENCEKKREELEGVGLSDSLIQIIKFAYKEGTKENENDVVSFDQRCTLKRTLKWIF